MVYIWSSCLLCIVTVEWCVHFTSKSPVVQRGEEKCPRSQSRTWPQATQLQFSAFSVALGLLYLHFILHYVCFWPHLPFFQGGSSSGTGFLESYSAANILSGFWLRVVNLDLWAGSAHQRSLLLSLKMPELLVTCQIWKRKKFKCSGSCKMMW